METIQLQPAVITLQEFQNWHPKYPERRNTVGVSTYDDKLLAKWHEKNQRRRQTFLSMTGSNPKGAS